MKVIQLILDLLKKNNFFQADLVHVNCDEKKNVVEPLITYTKRLLVSNEFENPRFTNESYFPISGDYLIECLINFNFESQNQEQGVVYSMDLYEIIFKLEHKQNNTYTICTSVLVAAIILLLITIIAFMISRFIFTDLGSLIGNLHFPNRLPRSVLHVFLLIA